MINRYHIQYTDSGTAQVRNNVKSLGRASKSTAKSTSMLSGAVMQLAAAYVSFQSVKFAVGILKEFDTTMLEVKAVTRATTQEFDMLSAAAREMGANTRFSASQSGEAILALARAGFSAKETVAALGDTLNLAIAGVLDIATASDLAAVTLKQFNMSAEETGRVADVIVTTANNSAQTVGDMAEAMKYAGAVASTMGYSLEETAAMLGVFANAGIRGSMAGTSFRMMLLNLASPSENFKDAVANLGLEISDLDPKVVSLEKIFKNLKDAGIGASEAQAIFGTRAAAASLSAAKFNGTISDMLKKLEDNDDAAKAAADTMDSGLNAAFLRLKSVTEELMLTFGDEAGFTGFLQGFVEVVTEVVKGIGIFVKKLADLGLLIGKLYFAWNETMNNFIEIAGITGWALIDAFQESFNFIYNLGYDIFENLGKSIFDLIHGGDSTRSTSEILAENWSNSFEKISTTWDIASQNIKKSMGEIESVWSETDFMSHYNDDVKETADATKETADATKKLADETLRLRNIEIGEGELQEITVPEGISTESIKKYADETEDIFDTMASSISQSLSNMFDKIDFDFGSLLDRLSSSIIKFMSDQMVKSLFDFLIAESWSSWSPPDVKPSPVPEVTAELAFGGEYSAGTPHIYNEYGTGEMHIPSVGGRVLSRNDAMKAVGQGGNDPNINIYNNLSDDEILSTFNTTKGERKIMNIIRKYGSG